MQITQHLLDMTIEKCFNACTQHFERISHICFIWCVMRIGTTPAFANTTADTASVYTTGARFSCMSWEQH